MEPIKACIDGTLDKVRLEWDDRPAVCVVMASGGYPGKYDKGKEITGLDATADMKDIIVFHAGTRSSNGGYVTSGGRVLGVTALGKDIPTAIDHAYSAVNKIHFEKVYFRTDIGHRALNRMK
jgi:phosphoribosylamine--glycine ligase